jgi:hypothetical protein
MSRVVPSQARAVIERLCPHVLDAAAEPPVFGHKNAGLVAGILAVVEAIPSDLIAVDGVLLAEFFEARGVAANFIEQVQGPQATSLNGREITRLYQVLRHCPDQAVPATVTSLAFVTDPDSQGALRSDLAEVERALIDNEWKSATVVAGSVVEALLLWALNQRRSAALAAGSALSNPTPAQLEYWNLHQYLEVSHGLGVIQDDTAAQLRLAKDFRNLIHPGRAIRLAKTCDRATARAAAAAVDFVIRDLTI